MKKIEISALVICLALSTGAYAQSSVTLYGEIDEALTVEHGTANGSKVLLAGGANEASRWGLKGYEDLGSGLAAIFVLENGFNATNGSMSQANSMFGRKAYVGLTGGWGTFIAGHMYTLAYSEIDSLDPEGGVGGGNDNMFSRGGTRISNAVRYDTPVVSGFSASTQYTIPGSGSRNVEAAARYANGPVLIHLVHNEQNGVNGTLPVKNTFLGGSYDFHFIRTFIGYEINRGLGGDQRDAKYDVAMVGFWIPTGAQGAVGATYIRATDKTSADNDAEQFAISYMYFLSKRTTIYTSYTHINNKNGTLNYVTAEAAGNTEFNLGITHKF
jgi:predicted porin